MTVIQEPPSKVMTEHRVSVITCSGDFIETPMPAVEAQDYYVDMIEYGLARTVILNDEHVVLAVLTIKRGHHVGIVHSGEMECGCER